MPYRKLPQSKVTTGRALAAGLQKYKLTANAVDRAIPPELFVKLDDADPNSIYNRFGKETHEVAIALAEQSPAMDRFGKAAEKLKKVVSHFHQVMDMAIDRGVYAPAVRAYYERDINATTIPSLTSHDEIGEAARNIQRGEADRQAAEGGDFKPMKMPDVDEVGGALVDFDDYRRGAQVAETKTNKEREESAALYEQAKELVEDIWDAVEYFYRKDKDDASRRNKCAQWGVVYVYENGEAESEAPATPTPPAAPAAATTPAP